MSSITSRVLAGILLLASLSPAILAADRSKNLPPRYRHWFNEEVTYIIDSAEKKEFLSLKTDAQRDSFIKEFWQVRNPDPNSETNAYKDEHYRRLAYANEHFGSIELQDGWRTDMGRMYIVLGPPKQIMTYPVARNVRPIEIWFYQSPSRALPPYFYLLFYKRSIGEPFTLYSPYQDGPVRLVSSLEALNDQKRSLEILRKSLGDEVAKTSLTLIPGESVNLNDYEPTLSSDVLLDQIAGLPDNPLTQEELNLSRSREHVTTSVLTGEHMVLSYEVFRDKAGRETLSYLLSSSRPDPELIGRRSNNAAYYDLTLRTSVATAAGVAVFNQEDELTGSLTDAQAEVAKKKIFAAEGRVPLAPGQYSLTVTLTNALNKVASQQRIDVTVPAVKETSMQLSGLLAYTQPAAVPDPQGELPFSASGLRFTPRGAQSVTIHEGEQLPLVFQVWMDPKKEDSTAGEKLHLHYAFGAVTASGASPTVVDEQVDASNRDEAGNLLTGHTLDTSSLDPGTYRLVVGANRVDSKQTAYESMTLHVEPNASFVGTWTAFAATDPGGAALDDLKRGMSAEAQNQVADARNWYMRALKENASDVRPLLRLAALLKKNGLTNDLAALSEQSILSNDAAPPKVLLAIAEALKATGRQKDEVKMLEAQIKLQPPNADLYRTLADACDATGDRTRANELRAIADRTK